MRIWGFFLLLLGNCLRAQPPLQAIPGLATQEVYDLLIDKKGYLWVGHELGISRFDGANFKHFTHPQQASLSMTDLAEDAFGRIWCHNFSGQVFYVQNERMELLKAYNHAKEPEYPHMVILNDELIVTSVNGLFICNTRNLQSRYVKSSNSKETRTLSIGLLKDRAIATDGKNWYSYNQAEGFKAIAANRGLFEPDNSLRLHPGTYGDTLLLIVNPAGILKMLVYQNNELKEVGRRALSSFINTTTVNHNDIWVHTNDHSTTLDGRKKINNSNFSDIITDAQGHTWISSLNRGLLVQYRPSLWQKVAVREVGGNDFVRCINVLDSLLVMGTQNAKLLVKDRVEGNVLWSVQLPDQAGAIEYIKPFDAGSMVVSTSSNTYLLDVKNKTYEIIPPYLMSRDVEKLGETIFFAGPGGLFATPQPRAGIDTQQWKRYFQKAFPGINTHKLNKQSPVFFTGQRCRAVRYDATAKKLVVAFKDGLYEFNMDGMRPVTYHNQPIYASALEYVGNKLFIASINNGLMIKTGNNIKHITVNEGLSSSSIIRMKAVDNHLWLFEGNAVQVLDIQAEKILAHIDLPSISGANAYDVVEVDSVAYLTTAGGLYQIPLQPSFPASRLNSYLNYIVVNNEDTVASNQVQLPYYKNNLSVHLSIPWYSPTQTVYFRYRLTGRNYAGSWQTVQGQEQEIRFASLMPGRYVFEAFAMVNGIAEKNGKTIAFTIKRPWWQQWWFVSSILLFGFAVFYAVYSFRLKQLLKVETIRRNISSDLHDEVGSTLSSINIYAELAKNEKDNKEYLQAIQDNAKDIITQLDDLVWSINPKNDSFEQLVKRMQLFAEPVLAAAGIQFTFHYNQGLLKQKLNINKKRNLYLIFKESVNNILKHAHSKQCTVNFYCRGAYVFLEVIDDGVGFDVPNRRQGRSGVNNIIERAKQIKAKVRILSSAEKGTTVYIAAPLK